MSKVFGAIEAGGTKFVCAIGAGPEDLHDIVRIDTTTPDETLGRTIAYFRQQHAHSSLVALGIGSFGPVDPDVKSPTFGFITSTPKPGWSNTDVVGALRNALHIPVGFDTDVNAAALGEHLWGAAAGLQTFIYLTLGTGVGGGAMVDGKLLHGLLHPEMGHIRIPHDRRADPFGGVCPFHADCFEGLASGPAIHRRWGMPAEALPADHPAWTLEAQYIGSALVNFICTLSPQRIILGGGVMHQRSLFPLIRNQVRAMLHEYIQVPVLGYGLEQFIVPPLLGDRSGILGAIALAQRAGTEASA